MMKYSILFMWAFLGYINRVSLRFLLDFQILVFFKLCHLGFIRATNCVQNNLANKQYNIQFCSCEFL